MSSFSSLRHLRRISTAVPSLAAAVPDAATATAASSISISRAKSKLRTEHDPDKALEIYSSVSKNYTSPLSTRYAQDLTVKRLAKARRFSEIESLIESHKNDPKITQEPFLCTLIRSYGIAGMFNHAMRTYEQMDQLGAPRSVLSFNALLAACNQSKLFDKVPQLFDEMPQRYGFKPDKISHGILIKSFCAAGLPEKALKVLPELQEKGVEVTTITFTTVLDALYKRGMNKEADELWIKMLRSGCELDAAAYNVRIMRVQGGKPEDVKSIIDEMNDCGLKPDTISYNYLMTCYLKNGMIEDANNVYQGLEANGCRPNAATFRTLIYYLCMNDDFEKGYKIFKESVKVHKIPDFGTLKHLVEGLVKKKKTKEAKGMIRTIKKKFPPNFLTAWKKVEDDLGLTSVDDASSVTDEVQEATA